MSALEIKERILQKDRSVLDQPGLISARVLPELLELCSHPDGEVRDLALSALNLLSGPPVREAIRKALRDPEVAIRSHAALFLHQHADRADLKELKVELAGNRDEFVREQVAMVLGKLNEPDMKPVLRGQLAAETDEYVSHALLLALARLGDEPSRRSVMARLMDDSPRVRVEALKDLEYLEDRKLARSVRPLLGDLRNAVNVGLSHSPEYIRVCDVAINTLDVLLAHPFPFVLQRTRRYGEGQIEQAINVLEQQP
jgi:HEAT repeat protein